MATTDVYSTLEKGGHYGIASVKSYIALVGFAKPLIQLLILKPEMYK